MIIQFSIPINTTGQHKVYIGFVFKMLKILLCDRVQMIQQCF